MPSPIITLRMTREDYTLLNAFAEQSDVDRSTVVRQAIHRLLDDTDPEDMKTMGVSHA